jgi:hypothetical protein
MNDTSPEITQKMCELIQMKTPEERFRMGCSMYDTSRYLVTRAIYEQYPGISVPEFRREFFLRFYGMDFSPEEREKIFRSLLFYSNF